MRKVLTNLTQKIRSEQPCGAVLYEKIRKSHRAQARIRKDHFVFDVTRQSAIQIERNGTVIWDHVHMELVCCLPRGSDRGKTLLPN
jgi:hypothetical protein